MKPRNDQSCFHYLCFQLLTIIIHSNLEVCFTSAPSWPAHFKSRELYLQWIDNNMKVYPWTSVSKQTPQFKKCFFLDFGVRRLLSSGWEFWRSLEKFWKSPWSIPQLWRLHLLHVCHNVHCKLFFMDLWSRILNSFLLMAPEMDQGQFPLR